MEDSWDDEEFDVPDFSSNVKSEAAPVSWEDEEEESEEEQAPTDVKQANAPLKPKQLKKLRMKEAEERRKLDAQLAREKAKEQMNESAEERRARIKKEMEEADYEAALDAFADVDENPADQTGKVEVESLEDAIRQMKLGGLADFDKLGNVVGDKIKDSNPKYIMEFLKSVIQKAQASLTADDMKDLGKVVSIIQNNKIQAAKPKGKKKKQSGKAGFAKVERSGGGMGAGHDDYYDDYDFM